MKLSATGRTAIASTMNRSRTRIFIPEKVQITGLRYVVPYHLLRFAATSATYSVTGAAQANVTLRFGVSSITIIEPFSMALLEHYYQLAAGQRQATSPGSDRQLLAVSKQNPGQLNPDQLLKYFDAKDPQKEIDGSLIIRLAAGKLINQKDYKP
ncbi:MAG TPA: hypothetical protein PKI15_10235 [Candidatus Cloacimonadota bacterium]|nr:hypothetical protein [Candidatus Cloacimonadota bacterium]